MPIVMSIPYSYMGSSALPVFSILALELFVVFFLLGASTMRDRGLGLRGAVVAGGGAFFWLITQAGYADAIVGLMALLAVIILGWLEDGALGEKERRLLLYAASLSAAMVAVLKQSGPLWWPWFALMAACAVKAGSPAEALRRLRGPLGLSLAVAAPWYLFNKLLIAQGAVAGNTLFLITGPELYHGRTTFLGRVLFALWRYPYYLVFIIPAVRGALKSPGTRLVSASAVFMILSWLFLFSYSTRNLRFPVMLSLFALGAALEDWVAAGGAARWRGRLSAFFRAVGRRLLSRPLLCGPLLLAVLLAASLAGGRRLDDGLLEARGRSALEIGETGVTKRVDWLMRRCPGRLLSADGRLKQLLSVDPGLFQFTVPEDGFDPSGYQYLVLDRPNLERLGQEAFERSFVEDQGERRFTVYINKGALDCLYGR
jgi:hypothetical protein